jgi:hypothetical protein
LDITTTCHDCGADCTEPYPFAGRLLCGACYHDATNPGGCGLYGQLEGAGRRGDTVAIRPLPETIPHIHHCPECHDDWRCITDQCAGRREHLCLPCFHLFCCSFVRDMKFHQWAPWVAVVVGALLAAAVFALAVWG